MPGVKRPHPQSSAEVKNEWRYTSAPPVCLNGIDKTTLPFLSCIRLWKNYNNFINILDHAKHKLRGFQNYGAAKCLLKRTGIDWLSGYAELMQRHIMNSLYNKIWKNLRQQHLTKKRQHRMLKTTEQSKGSLPLPKCLQLCASNTVG